MFAIKGQFAEYNLTVAAAMNVVLANRFKPIVQRSPLPVGASAAFRELRRRLAPDPNPRRTV
jgi:hypothetical protein